MTETSAEVTLTWAELQQAALVGCQRRLRALSRGRQDRYGTPQNDLWGVDISAAAAELAVAKALNVYWADSQHPDYHGDVGAYFVRSTALDYGSLILYRDDPDDRAFVLVCGTAPTFRLVGWLMARDGKRDEFWQTTKTRVPCFLVPQNALTDIGDLRWASRVAA